MRRVLLWLTGLIPVLAAAACGAGGGSTTAGGSHPGQAYRDSSGWTVEVPSGWHAVRFRDSKDGITSAGVQLSNVQLPPPTLVPGFPIQVNGGVLPAHGVGLIIATDPDPTLSHGPVAVPPLPAPHAPDGWKYWNAGSCSPAYAGAASPGAGCPYIETLWFRIKGVIFIASTKIGPKTTNGDMKAVAAIVQSLR